MLDQDKMSTAAKKYVQFLRVAAKYEEAKRLLKAEQEAVEARFWKTQGGLYQQYKDVEAEWEHVRQDLLDERIETYNEHGNSKEVYGDVLQIRCTYSPRILDADETVNWLENNGLGGFVVKVPSNAVTVNVKEDMKQADKANPQYSPLYQVPDHLVSREKKYALVVKEGFSQFADLTQNE